MTNKQLDLLKLCKFIIKKESIEFDHNSLVSMFYDEKTKLFSIKIKKKIFTPGDYDSVEAVAVDLSRMLGMAYELNMIGESKNEN